LLQEHLKFLCSITCVAISPEGNRIAIGLSVSFKKAKLFTVRLGWVRLG